MTSAVDAERRTSEERRFLSPRGRKWTVRLHECLDPDWRPQTVERFTAGDTVVEVEHSPPRWRECSVEQYALMLLDAKPPRRTGAAGPQRRHTDRPE